MTSKRFRRWAGLTLGILLFAAIAGPFVYSVVELARFERADARRSTFIYAAAQSLAPGVHVQRIALATTLARLGYAETRAAPSAPGHFRRLLRQDALRELVGLSHAQRRGSNLGTTTDTLSAR